MPGVFCDLDTSDVCMWMNDELNFGADGRKWAGLQIIDLQDTSHNFKAMDQCDERGDLIER